MASYKTSDGNTDSDGVNVFPSGGYGGFFGTTPAVQQASALGTTNSTTVAVSTTTGAVTSWGFASSTQANNIITQLNSIYGALTTYGLLST